MHTVLLFHRKTIVTESHSPVQRKIDFTFLRLSVVIILYCFFRSLVGQQTFIQRWMVQCYKGLSLPFLRDNRILCCRAITLKICTVYWIVLCYHPYLVSIPFAGLLSLHLVTLLMFFKLVRTWIPSTDYSIYRLHVDFNGWI